MGRAWLTLGLLVGAASASAQLPEGPMRVAVVLLPLGGLEQAVADDLSELLIGRIAARGGVRILGREEFQAQLGQGRDGTLDCLGSMACMGRVGVELGVREVIGGTVTRRNGRWVFNLNRIDVVEGALVGRAFREVEGDLGAVADALTTAAEDIYRRTAGPPLTLAAASTGQRDDVAPDRDRPALSPWFWISAVGAALSLAGGIALTALASRDLEVGGEDGPTQREVEAFYDARRREEIGAYTLYALTAVGLGVMVAELVRWARARPAPIQPAVVLAPTAMLAGLRGELP
ncbi:MAG: hypothetical protein ACFCGT_17080 [Sandaracinaceae bacterium]